MWPDWALLRDTRLKNLSEHSKPNLIVQLECLHTTPHQYLILNTHLSMSSLYTRHYSSASLFGPKFRTTTADGVYRKVHGDIWHTIQRFRPMQYWPNTAFGAQCSTGLGYIPVPGKYFRQWTSRRIYSIWDVHNPRCMDTCTYRHNNDVAQLSPCPSGQRSGLLFSITMRFFCHGP